MPRTIRIVGMHADKASADDIAAAIWKAQDVFAKNNADPWECQQAIQKMERDELLTREEALLCLVWDEAEDAAFHSVTFGWLIRGIADIGIEVVETAEVS